MYSLSIWNKPNSDEVRVYVNGTTRDGVYLKARSNGDGSAVWSSRTNDTPSKYQTGQHYSKVKKDGAAAREVAEAYGWTLGETLFETVLTVARDGIQAPRS